MKIYQYYKIQYLPSNKYKIFIAIYFFYLYIAINLALFAELNWRMHVEKDQAWAKFLQRKYANQERKCSRTWAAMK